MTLQWAGAILIIAGCGGVGFSMAAGYRRDIALLRHLIQLLNEMEWELQYHLTPLPDLCRQVAKNRPDALRNLFLALGSKLSDREHPDVRNAMEELLSTQRVPGCMVTHLKNLGESLGRYDLPGQLQGLRFVKSACRKELNELEQGRAERIRGYQTLALCAGAAIAVILC